VRRRRRTMAVAMMALREGLLSPLVLMALATFAALAGLVSFLPVLQAPQTAVAAHPFALFEALPTMMAVLVALLASVLWARGAADGTLAVAMAQGLGVRMLVPGRFSAGLMLIAVALVLVTPVWIALAWMGPVDHGAVGAAWAVAFLMGAAQLAFAFAVAVLVGRPIATFVLAASLLVALNLLGGPTVQAAMEGVFGPGPAGALAALSPLSGWRAVTDGALGARDVLQLLLLLAAGLSLAMLVADAQRETAAARAAHLPLSVLGMIGLYAGLCLLALQALGDTRSDLTAARIATPDPALVAAARALGEPVTLRFASGPGEAGQSARRSWGELLARLQRKAPDTLRLEIVPGDASGVSGPTLTATNSLEERVTLDLDPARGRGTLQRQIALALLDLEAPRTRMVSIVTGVPAGTPALEALMARLRGQGPVLLLPADFATIPEQTEVLVVARPGPLTEPQVYAIDQFLLARGRAVLVPGAPPPVAGDIAEGPLAPILRTHDWQVPPPGSHRSTIATPQQNLVTAWPGGRPLAAAPPAGLAAPVALPVGPPRPHRATSLVPAHVVVVAEAEPFVPAGLSVPAGAAGADQTAQWIETLLLPSALMAAPPPVDTDWPPLERKDERTVQDALLLSAIAVPALVLAAGLAAHLLRRRRRSMIQPGGRRA